MEKIDDDILTSSLKKISLGVETKDGVFDFADYPNLKRVTLMNCDHLVHVKLPNKDIETDGMNNNPNLQWIDTGDAPSFYDFDDKDFKNDGYTEGKGDGEGKKFPIYSKGSKLILCSDNTFYNCPKYAMLRSDWNTGGKWVKDGNAIAYTNIIVSDKCTSLANTFCINTSNSSDDKFNMKSAIRFIEKCVPDEVKEKITSLAGCFRGRKGVTYTREDAQAERGYSEITENNTKHPRLNNYISVTDISELYANTGVNFVSKFLLDLPFANNTSAPEHMLTWESFILPMTKLNITNDALYNISYRLRSYSYINFTIYEYNADIEQYEIVGKDVEHTFRMCDFFYPLEAGKTYTDNGCVFDDNVKPYRYITSLDSIGFVDRYIDFRGLLNLFPNVRTISSFLNGNLSKYNIQGLLYPCKNITSIVQSFCDTNVNDRGNTQEIDLFNFFDWKNNTTNVEKLFEGIKSSENGFRIRKTITYDNLQIVLGKISEYTKLTRLTNLFSYCTITGCNTDVNRNPEIKFDNGVVLSNIKNISNLFDNCTTDCKLFSESDADNKTKGIYTGGVLNVGRSFFKSFPNFTTAIRTLSNTYLSSSLTYDYFCKRSNGFTETPVYLSESLEDVATLYEYTYNSNILYLTECFYNTKFVGCKNWFDPNDDDNMNIVNKDEDRNHILYKGDKLKGRDVVYYTYSALTGFKRHTLNNDGIDDCLDNYTDYVPQNRISTGEAPYIWYNHDLKQDLLYYGNINSTDRPFDPINESCVDTIQETYCCLPPDMLYGCASTVEIDSIFANSNIIGVIPRNLTKMVKDRPISNIFRNVNIMPNLEYYYDKNGSLNSSILHKVAIDGDLIGDESEYKVVFRDEVGRLKRRKPVGSDRNLGQFVYVPANFTTCGTIMNAFNFRYNLPAHWEMPQKFVNANGITIESYKSTYELNSAITNKELDASTLLYHTQYYFTTDKSVKWDSIYDAKSVFINNYQDIDFSNNLTLGVQREYYNEDEDFSIDEKNVWTNDGRVSKYSNWTANILDYFYVDLNLCGKKNEYNMIEDHGCPIIVENRRVHLDNFVSGVLTIFLNGRVFNETFLVDKLTTTNHKANGSTSIIDYYGFGKNIILPYFNGYPLDDKLVFIPIDNDFIYFDFMVECNGNSIANYYTYFAKGNIRNNYLFETKYKKYIFK